MICFIAFGFLLINYATGRFADFSDLPGFQMPYESTPVLPTFSQSFAPLGSNSLQSSPNQIRRPVCGILNGIWKNFDNFQQLSAEVRQGKAWRVFRFGLCPIIEPICAQYGNKIKFFDNILALDVYNYITKKVWIMVPCPLKPICAQYSTEFRIFKSILQMKQNSAESGKNWLIMDPCPLCVEYKNEFQVFLNSTTLEMERYLTGKNWLPTPCSELVCAKSNKEYKTFKNILQLNAENLSAGKTWLIVYKGICGTFDDAMAYTEISSNSLTTSSTISAPQTPPRKPRLAPHEITTTTTTKPYLRINSKESTIGNTTFESSSSYIPSSPTTLLTTTSFLKPTSVHPEQFLQINRYQTNNHYNGPYVEGPFYYYSNAHHHADLKSLPNYTWRFFKKERNDF